VGRLGNQGSGERRVEGEWRAAGGVFRAFRRGVLFLVVPPGEGMALRPTRLASRAELGQRARSSQCAQSGWRAPQRRRPCQISQ
jgi:hypothetical protein